MVKTGILLLLRLLLGKLGVKGDHCIHIKCFRSLLLPLRGRCLISVCGCACIFIALLRISDSFLPSRAVYFYLKIIDHYHQKAGSKILCFSCVNFKPRSCHINALVVAAISFSLSLSLSSPSPRNRSVSPLLSQLHSPFFFLPLLFPFILFPYLSLLSIRTPGLFLLVYSCRPCAI